MVCPRTRGFLFGHPASVNSQAAHWLQDLHERARRREEGTGVNLMIPLLDRAKPPCFVGLYCGFDVLRCEPGTEPIIAEIRFGRTDGSTCPVIDMGSMGRRRNMQP